MPAIVSIAASVSRRGNRSCVIGVQQYNVSVVVVQDLLREIPSLTQIESERDVAVLAALGFVTAIALVRLWMLHARVRALESEAITDPLTGVFNRRHFDASLVNAVERRGRYGEPASLLVFDIDRFKDVNDALGHSAGDQVLKSLAALVRRRTRKLDVLFRIGGEEFALLMPGTRLPDAMALAEDLRARVAHAPLVDGRRVSVSIGVGEYRDGQTAAEWIADADGALYTAKRRGRNCVAQRSARVLALG